MAIIVLAFLVICSLFVLDLKIVPLTENWLVERLGKYSRTLNAGVHIITPFFDPVAHKENILERQLPVKSVPSITKDNVQIEIKLAILYRLTDASNVSAGLAEGLDRQRNPGGDRRDGLFGQLHAGIGQLVGLGNRLLDRRFGEAGLQIDRFLDRFHAHQRLREGDGFFQRCLAGSRELLGNVLETGGINLAGLDPRFHVALAEHHHFLCGLHRLLHVFLDFHLRGLKPLGGSLHAFLHRHQGLVEPFIRNIGCVFGGGLGRDLRFRAAHTLMFSRVG
jgi:SPFH domain / Band 7 family